MKKTITVLLVAATVLLAGCGSAKASQLYIEGTKLFESQDFFGAVSKFNEALEYSNTKEDKDIFRALGIAYMSMERYDDATTAFLEALHSGSGFIEAVDYDINYYLADAYAKGGHYSEAASVYTAIINMKPKDTDAYYRRAGVYLIMGDKTAAGEDFAVVTAADPKNIDTYLDIYFTMTDAGFGEDARAYLKATLDNSPGSTSDYDKGRMCYYLEDYSNARVYLEKAKNMDDPNTILMLGKTYEAIEDYSYAASLYNTYLTTKGNNAGVYNQLGVCRMKMEDYEAALQAFSAGLNLDDPEWNRKLKFNEAITYEYMLEFDSARERMKQYLFEYPRDEEALREYEFLKSR